MKNPIPSHLPPAAPPAGASAGAGSEAPVTALIVEDDSATRRLLQKNLEKAGFLVRTAEDGETAVELFQREPAQVVILDIMLPGMDGFEVCRRLREHREATAILMLTAKREDDDKINGLDLGADDYMVKPFNPRELTARLRAILRRCALRPGAADALAFKDLRIDFRAQKAFKGDCELDLTPREFALLGTFLQNPGKVLTREELNDKLWGKGHHGSSKSLDVYVRKLREKMEEDPSRPTRLRTAWGVGYVCE